MPVSFLANRAVMRYIIHTAKVSEKSE